MWIKANIFVILFLVLFSGDERDSKKLKQTTTDAQSIIIFYQMSIIKNKLQFLVGMFHVCVTGGESVLLLRINALKKSCKSLNHCCDAPWNNDQYPVLLGFMLRSQSLKRNTGHRACPQLFEFTLIYPQTTLC